MVTHLISLSINFLHFFSNKASNDLLNHLSCISRTEHLQTDFYVSNKLVIICKSKNTNYFTM